MIKSMPSAVANVPAETDLVCESCGYVLNGLPDDARCPECGKPTAESAPSRRGPPAWEEDGFLPIRFFRSTFEILFHPRRFYRSLNTRAGRSQSRVFALIHLVLASLVFGVGEFVHARAFVYLGAYPFLKSMGFLVNDPVPGTLVFAAAAFVALAMTAPIAGRLTSWEARYRGFRLPLKVVLRGLDFHAAHYLPVALMATFTIVGYRLLADHTSFPWLSDAGYLYVICGEVIVGAIYLFWTYWIGMRNMMFANA